MLEQNHSPVIIGFRFIYKIRNITPFVPGMSQVKTSKFIDLNILATMTWAISFGTAGFFFGVTMEDILEDMKQYQRTFILAFIFIILVIWFFNFYSKKKYRLK